MNDNPELNNQSTGIAPAYITRRTRLSVVPLGEPVFSEHCTHISIVDEANGEFLQIEQQSGSMNVKEQTIMVTPEEWPALKQAIETLMSEIDRNKMP